MSKVYVSGKVNLFVNERFFHPDIEPLVLDELFKWLTLLEQTVRQHYIDDLNLAFPEVPEFDPALKKSEVFGGGSMYPVVRILEALEEIGSAYGRKELRAMEYLFRPKVNDYRLIEQKRGREGSLSAIEKPEEISVLLDTVTVYHLSAILDRMICIADPQYC